MKQSNHSTSDEKAFAELLRSAGRGPRLSDEARRRIRSNVEMAWRQSLRDTELGAGESGAPSIRRRNAVPTAARRRRFRQRWLAPSLAATLAVAASLVLLSRPEAPTPITRPSFAQVSALEGSVRATRNGQEATMDASVLVGDVVRTDENGRAALQLPGGEELRLNTDTTVELTESNSIRLVAGMVYFDARPDSDHADFFVTTDFGTIAHVGTQYAASIDDERLTVSVREGEALISDDSRQLAAGVGDRIRVDRSGDIERSVLAVDAPEWAWTESLARADFDGPSSILALVEWAARQSGRVVRIDSDEVRDRAEGVTLNQVNGLTPTEVFTVIQSTTEFELTQSQTELAVSLR